MNFRNKIKKQGFFLIAEIGNNHGGSIKTAKKMILEANKAGADAIKLQYIKPENFIHPNEKKKIDILKKICLTKNQILELYKFSKKKKIEIFSSIFDINEVSFFSNIQNYNKIASGDNNFIKLFEKISKKKPTFISTGFLDKNGVKNLYNKIKKYWPNKNFIRNNVCLMHCISSYPADYESLNLLFLNTMNDKHYIKGFSDHSIGIDACIIANILGAKVIEKHFTLNKKNNFRDHQLSADPKDFSKLREKLILNQKILGKNVKKLSISEKTEKMKSRRSIVSKKKILYGQKIKATDILYLRPRIKDNLFLEKKIINKKSKKNYSQYDYF